MDLELMRNVLADINYLNEEWNQDIDDQSLRRSSTVLRNLLIEDQLIKVASYLKEEISIMAPLVSKYEDQLNDPSIIYYQCGGAKFNGTEIFFIKISTRDMTPESIKADNEKQKDMDGRSYAIKLSKFMKQASFMIDKVRINREEVIKYIVNKKGGAHYDSSRKNNDLERKYSLLDSIYSGIQMVDKNAVYYELLSIGQRLIGSVDVARVRQILKCSIKNF